jgi:fructan beta-fructosidase
MDYGKDYYAAVSFFGHPVGDPRRIMIGWFSNWEYANDTPETDWRGAMAFPREISLKKTDEGVRMAQLPVKELDKLRNQAKSWAIAEHAITVAEANEILARDQVRGKVLRIDMELTLGTARMAGVMVFKGGHDRTLIGVDGPKEIVFIDRTHSGMVSFNPHFPGRQEGPLHDAKNVTLEILLDRSSVEVFAENGGTTLADRVYPSEHDDGIEVFAEGGSALIRSLQIAEIDSIWK